MLPRVILDILHLTFFDEKNAKKIYFNLIYLLVNIFRGILYNLRQILL